MIESILEADRYLQVDQVERARNAYQRVVDLDPGNSIAVVGLARCALADGDEQGAHALAARALEIDPENDMARRMEARLSEILATRGEPVTRPPSAGTPPPKEMRAVVTPEPAGAGQAPVAASREAGAPVAAAPGRAAPVPETRKSFVDRLLGR